jgi:hypothetical protein
MRGLKHVPKNLLSRDVSGRSHSPAPPFPDLSASSLPNRQDN